MRDEDKTKKQLIRELKKLRQRASGDSLSKGKRRSSDDLNIEMDAHHDALIYTIPDIVYFKDIQGRNLVVNKAFEEFVGLREAEIIGKTDDQLFPPELAAHCLQSDREVIKNRKTIRFDEEYTGRDGEKIYFDTIKSPLVDDSGNVIGVVGVSHDITGRKKLEGHLGLFKTLLNQSNDAIFIIDPQTGRFLDVNDKVCSNLGYSRDELLNMGVSDIETILPDHFSWKAHVREVKEGGFMILEGRHKRKDGTTFPVEVNVKYMTHGENDYMVAVVRDITEHKRAEERKMLDQKRFMQELIDSLPGTFYLIDEHGYLERWNNYFEMATGYSSEEIREMNILDFIPEDEKTYVMKKMKDVFTTGRATAEVNLLSKDGRKTPYFGTGIQTTINNKPYLVGVGIDISEQKRLEQEILKAQKLDSIGVLAGGIAHDFNNILTAIIGYISLSKESLNPESDVYKRLSEAEKAGFRAQELTGQLLTFSKGGAPLKRTISIGQVIKESADFALAGSKVKCVYSIGEDLRPVEADEGQISQVIHNLVINADQAMPGGGIITIQCENVSIGTEDLSPLKEGNYIKISIEDRGLGIPEEHLQKIFDPYFTTKQKGSGLGLSTAYSIIKKHDGLITVDSTMGVGTTFHIYLLASEKEVVSETVEGKALISGKGKILVMDDEEMIRKVAGEILGYIGYKVEFAKDGTEAIGLYKEARDAGEPFDLLIMDLTIPGGMGGKDVIRELLKLDPDVKAIVSSGYSNDPILSDYEKYGFEGVATKPYKVTELSHIVYEVITNKVGKDGANQ